MRRDKQDKQELSWELFEGATLQVVGTTGVINKKLLLRSQVMVSWVLYLNLQTTDMSIEKLLGLIDTIVGGGALTGTTWFLQQHNQVFVFGSN